MSTSAPTIFAIDLGTQSLRLSAFHPDGARVWSWSAPVNSIVRGSVYTQDPAEWANHLRTALQEAKTAGLQPDIIAATGPLAGWVPLDSEGNSIGEAVMYLDGRSAMDAQAVGSAIAHTPHADQSFRVVPSDPLPNLLRLRREEPEIFARTSTLLDATGWLNTFLTGERTLNTYTALRLYTAEVRDLLGLSGLIFGKVTPIGAMVGKLKASIAQTYGFAQVPVISAPFDSKCAYIAAGLSQEGRGLDVSGTVTSVGIYQQSEVRDPQQRIYSVPLNDGWLVRGSTACSGSIITWAQKHLLKTDMDTWTSNAATVSPGSNGVTFLPYLAGERTPLWNSDARGALLGLGLDTADAVISRAVLESLAFSFRHVIDCMKECGARVDALNLSGGLAQNDFLSQMKSDVTGLPLHRLTNHELTSQGLVAICGVALGKFSDFAEAASQLVKTEKIFLPQAENTSAYEKAYHRYRMYADVLLPTFHTNEIL